MLLMVLRKEVWEKLNGNERSDLLCLMAVADVDEVKIQESAHFIALKGVNYGKGVAQKEKKETKRVA